MLYILGHFKYWGLFPFIYDYYMNVICLHMEYLDNTILF